MLLYPRPILTSGYCRCLRLSVRPSVSPSVRPSVTKFVRAITHHSFKLGSPNLDHMYKRPWLRSLLVAGWLTLNFKVKINSKVKIYPILSLWFCPRHKSPPIEVRISKLDQKCILTLLRCLFGDWLSLIFSFIFNFKPLISYQTLRLLFICVVLHIFSEAIACECSTSHMALYITWLLRTRTGSRHGPWNSLLLYLGDTIGVQPASTRRLTLAFTSCYRFSYYYIRFIFRNFICEHSSITETTVKQHPLAFLLFDFQHWESTPSFT